MTDIVTRTWSIEDAEGNVWMTEAAYTGAMAISVCTVLARDEWEVVDPTLSPFALMGLLIVLFMQRTECNIDEARFLVLSQPMDSLMAMLKVT